MTLHRSTGVFICHKHWVICHENLKTCPVRYMWTDYGSWRSKLLFFSHCQIVCNAKFTRETRTKYVPYTNGQTYIIEQLNFAYFSWFCLPVVMRSWRNAWQTFLSWQTTCVAFPNHSTYSFIKLNYPCCTVGTTSFFVMN